MNIADDYKLHAMTDKWVNEAAMILRDERRWVDGKERGLEVGG
jgi:hypothetical protein